ncbi:uncharacterized protein V1510DRAFT_401154 [Dipodascopsis tothii]|uniref:uncharacterized protein n=1 Tax=Dipodascopsis tothii TaxID=44089 RepID=UPI0034CFF874
MTTTARESRTGQARTRTARPPRRPDTDGSDRRPRGTREGIYSSPGLAQLDGARTAGQQGPAAADSTSYIGETWESVAARMHAYVRKGQIESVFKLASGIRAARQIPPPPVYAEVLMAMAHVGNGLMLADALALVEELKANAMITPQAFQQLFKVLSGSRDPFLRSRVLELARREGHNLRPIEWKYVIQSYLVAREYELALATLLQCKRDDQYVLPRTYENVCYGMLAVSDVAAATRTLRMFVDDHGVVPARLWGQVLAAAAAAFDHAALEWLWQAAVASGNVLPDDGTLLNVLMAAGRHGDPFLGGQALRLLVERDVPLDEHVLAPLVEAFARHKDIGNAWATMIVARRKGVRLSQPTLDVVSAAVGRSYSATEKAVLHAVGHFNGHDHVEELCFVTLLGGCVHRNDVEGAVRLFFDRGAFRLPASVPMYHYLVAAAAANGMKTLADELFRHLVAASLAPTRAILENMVAVQFNGPDYADGLVYLDQHRTALNVPPSRSVYARAIAHCIFYKDYDRASELVERMRADGYFVFQLADLVARHLTGDPDAGLPRNITITERGLTPAERAHEAELVALFAELDAAFVPADQPNLITDLHFLDDDIDLKELSLEDLSVRLAWPRAGRRADE